MTMLYGIYGTGGHGRETLPLLRRQADAHAKIVFIDDQPVMQPVNGHAVLSWDEFLTIRAHGRAVSLAIGSGRVRERLHVRAMQMNVSFVRVQAENATILDDVEIGAGAILSSFVSLTSNIRIGLHFHANTFCSIAHDCVIGDFVTLGPGVRCNGNVIIEDYAYIGSAAVIRQGRGDKPLVIGRGAVVGMGAVVTKDVPAGATVVGNPARPLIKD
jgi:sugar O-acyltransferase (sialic acid O-acetyltransferase NeuD family)